MSTCGQDLDTQLATLAAEGVESAHVFTGKLSGAVKVGRPGLAALLHNAREGDTVVARPSISWADPSPKLSAPSRIWVSAEFWCAPCAKGLIRVHQPAGR